MEPIKFIDNLNLSSKGVLVSAGSNNRGQEIFMRQGSLDACCAIYSLMMMLIINRRINYRDLVSRDTRPGYTSVKRLQDQFLGNLRGLYKDGYFFDDLSDELSSSFKKVATAETCTTLSDRRNVVRRDDLHKTLKDTLDSGHPVQIGFTRKGGQGGHAVVAIGYQMVGSNVMRLFCLDPGYDLPALAFWNTIIDIELDSNIKGTYIDYNHQEKLVCSVDEILIIR